MFAINFPNAEALATIYTSILSQHLAMNSFAGAVQKYAATLIQGALALHAKVTTTFLPTAIKFHYIFNLRDLSNIFQVWLSPILILNQKYRFYLILELLNVKWNDTFVF